MRNLLLILPIHRRSYKRYYYEHGEYEKKQELEIEGQWGCSFGELGRKMQFRCRDRWFWPPWLHNDIVGFLEVGTTGSSHMTGDVYLMRKKFPRESRERAYAKYDTPKKKQEILYYQEIPKVPIQPGHNERYILAAEQIIKEANKLVRRRVRTGRVWVPRYELSCINMAEADRQMKLTRQ